VGAGILQFVVSILIEATFLLHAETAAASMHAQARPPAGAPAETE
jgi:hypothetical protein